jgi:hypothetical protein
MTRTRLDTIREALTYAECTMCSNRAGWGRRPPGPLVYVMIKYDDCEAFNVRCEMCGTTGAEGFEVISIDAARNELIEADADLDRWLVS